jgi:hypothetical protein
MDDPALLDAYLSYYWPVSYAQASGSCSCVDCVHPGCWILVRGLAPWQRPHLTGGLQAPVPGGPFHRSLGAGRTAAGRPWAVCRGCLRCRSRDRGKLCPRYKPLCTNTKPPAIQCIQADLEAPQAIPAGPFDLVILGHCLNELGGDAPDQKARVERRAALLQRAASALAPGGSVMIVDPATLASARDGMALRDHLAGLGWLVTGPCTRQGPCPALAAGENQSCHDEAAWAMPEVGTAPGRGCRSGPGEDKDVLAGPAAASARPGWGQSC